MKAAEWSKRCRHVEGDPRSIVCGRTFVAATSGTSRLVAGGQKRTGTPGRETREEGRMGEEVEVCVCTRGYMQPHIG